MTSTCHFSIKNQSLLILLAFFFVALFSNQAFAQRNVCNECRHINMPESTLCASCSEALNLCLDCGTDNPANADFCSNCNAPLAEMRLLGKIDPKTRKDLKLGQSDRAQTDKELMKIAHLLEKTPEDSEKLIFKRSMLLNRMGFHSREAESWREFLNKFPETAKKTVAKAYLSEALRKWSFLFYAQKNKTMALTLLNEAIENNAANVDAWQWLGRINMETKNKPEAIKAYMQALKLEPGNRSFIHFLRKMKADIPTELMKKSTDGQ